MYFWLLFGATSDCGSVMTRRLCPANLVKSGIRQKSESGTSLFCSFTKSVITLLDERFDWGTNLKHLFLKMSNWHHHDTFSWIGIKIRFDF